MFFFFFSSFTFYLLEKALFRKTFRFIFFLLLFVLHVNQYSLILLCHFFWKIKIEQNIFRKRLCRVCFSSFLFLAPTTQFYPIYIMPENRKNKKHTAKRVFHSQNSKRKERVLRVKNLKISSLNLMKSYSKDKNLRYSKFLSYATKVAVNCLPMHNSYGI